MKKNRIMSAREVMARAQADYWDNPDIPEEYWPMVDAQLAALTAAGFRVLAPEEVDPVTVEKCAEVADAEAAKHQGPFTSQPAYVVSCAIRDALRALKEKQP